MIRVPGEDDHGHNGSNASQCYVFSQHRQDCILRNMSLLLGYRPFFSGFFR
jgi:hypothetical protein